MAKLIEKDGKFYRMRRGKLVEIPQEWVGKTVYKQTIRKRKSKRSPKEQDQWDVKHPNKSHSLERINKKDAELLKRDPEPLLILIKGIKIGG